MQRLWRNSLVSFLIKACWTSLWWVGSIFGQITIVDLELTNFYNLLTGKRSFLMWFNEDSYVYCWITLLSYLIVKKGREEEDTSSLRIFGLNLRDLWIR
jgi:hypothetical protein